MTGLKHEQSRRDRMAVSFLGRPRPHFLTLLLELSRDPTPLGDDIFH